uniref:Phospholipid:diacylglycerol acyltransferase n=1 Tax=Mycena chlorophos TaxID=658473 RepID=A0ABQ0M3G1_MYCCL|nr:phospholipid:diacylglycerol acyltransferase [Mycena chlorophos]
MPLVHRAKTDPGSATKPPSEQELTSKLIETTKTLKAEVHKHKHNRPSWFARRRLLFPLGLFLGSLLAFSLIEPRDIQDLHAQLLLLLGEYTPILEIPGLDLSLVENEWQRLRSSIPEIWKFSDDGREFSVGEAMRDRSLSAEHPVVLVPGVISTALESWSTDPEYRAFFRQRLWGGFSMLTHVTFNQRLWMSAMMLDPVTGLDPPGGGKVRAAEGIDAAANFIQGYWVWRKIVENLAVVNYDTNNMHMAPYDWRLSYYNLEVRDGYFSRLKSTIEGFKHRQNKKVVLVAHSMGATVALVSFKWVESPDHGRGGPTWVEDHIDSYITIGGTHLGVASAMSAFLSGEMKDTVALNPAGAYVLERFFSRAERQRLFRSWAGSASMWVKGGETIWGGTHGAPDDPMDNSTHTHGQLIAFRQAPPPPGSVSTSDGILEEVQNLTAHTASDWILQNTPSSFQKMIATNFSFGIEKDEAKLKANNHDHTKWSNPLEVQLPNAPSMKMYCIYGHGKETERSYWYAQDPNAYDETADKASGMDPMCVEPNGDGCTVSMPFDSPLVRKSYIDAQFTDEAAQPRIQNGVNIGEGDGSVNLISLGAMCVEGWKRERWNPGRINVTTVELPHQPVSGIPRGGATTADHVDILGSTPLNELILKVATGVGYEIQEQFVSNIREYAGRIHWD